MDRRPILPRDVSGSFIPEKKIRILRECIHYRYKLVSFRSSEKSLIQNAFTVCNVAFDSIVSDIFCKSAFDNGFTLSGFECQSDFV